MPLHFLTIFISNKGGDSNDEKFHLLVFFNDDFLYLYLFWRWKTYFYLKPDVDFTKVKKEKIDSKWIYSDETKAEKYVNFLLENKFLQLDYENNYSSFLIDKKEQWLVLLDVTKTSDKDEITICFDNPTKYAFFMEKDTGKISDLYLIKQNHIPIANFPK